MLEKNEKMNPTRFSARRAPEAGSNRVTRRRDSARAVDDTVSWDCVKDRFSTVNAHQ